MGKANRVRRMVRVEGGIVSRRDRGGGRDVRCEGGAGRVGFKVIGWLKLVEMSLGGDGGE